MTTTAPLRTARRPRPRRAVPVAIATAALVAGGLLAAGPGAAAPKGFAKRVHRPTKLVITVPAAYRMSFRKGVYVLRAPGRTLTFSRVVTPTAADVYLGALLGQIGGTVTSRTGGAREASAQIDFGTRKDAIEVERRRGRLLVTTSSSTTGATLTRAALRTIGRSARRGVALRAPLAGVGQPVPPIPLRAFRAFDGGATAQVPSGSDWRISDQGGGIVSGFSNDGAFTYGVSLLITPPGLFAPGTEPSSAVVAPYMNAATALTDLVPRLFAGVANVRIRQVVRDAVLPTYTSSGMVLFDYTQNGVPWTGLVVIGTDSPLKYSNLAWGFYYSGVGVRQGARPSVGQGLMKSWGSWDPSGAVAQRTANQLRLINETNAIWQSVSEFRSVTADRQARDVGCLLLGYYVIEDNSRKYDLPPAACGREYVPTS